MSYSYMDWIERYNLIFQLHIKETEESNIYNQINLKDVTENLMTFNNTIVDVISTTRINDSFYFKIKYKNNLIGWCSPRNNTILYIKNRKQEVRILDEGSIDNDLNQTLEIDTAKLKDNWIKIFVSDFYAIHNNKIYCAILLKEELLGFIEISDVSFFINFRKNFNFVRDDVNLYKDSKLEKVIKENFEHENALYSSLGTFEKFDGVRIVVDGKRYWADINATDLKVEQSVIETFDDVIIDALLYQLKDKVEKQNDYYSNRISKLQEKIKALELKEKQTKQNINKLKEIL